MNYSDKAKCTDLSLEFAYEEDLTPDCGVEIDKICEKIYKACKGWGTDEEGLIGAMGSATPEDRFKIGLRYKDLYGKSLKSVIQGETSGDFRKAMMKYLSLDETDVELGSTFDSVLSLESVPKETDLELDCTFDSASVESVPKQHRSQPSSPQKYSSISKLSSPGPKADPPTSSASPDATLILGMERTLFAALNNAWLLAIAGVGLMSVGGKEDRAATQGGIAILVASILSVFIAYSMHFFRIYQLKHNSSFRYSHTLLWAGMISMLTFTSLILEMHYGILSPYLLREKTVAIANPDD